MNWTVLLLLCVLLGNSPASAKRRSKWKGVHLVPVGRPPPGYTNGTSKNNKGCSFYIKGSQEFAGFGHVFCKRNNAWILILALREAGVEGACFLWFPLTLSRKDKPNLDTLFHHPSNWTQEGDKSIESYRRLRFTRNLGDVGHLAMGRAVRILKPLYQKGALNNTIIELASLTVSSHCSTVHTYWRPYFHPLPATLFGNSTSNRCLSVAMHSRKSDAARIPLRQLPDDYQENVAAHLVEWYTANTTVSCMDFHIFTGDTKSTIPQQIESRLGAMAKKMKFTTALHTRSTSAASTLSHFVRADVLVSARSGFSNIAGMLSHGVKLAIPLWHATDCDELWVGASDKGQFDRAAFSRAWSSKLRKGLGAEPT